jgi:hypothetical protein
MRGLSAQVVLVIHFVWAVWMVSGVLVALAGFIWRRVWGWRVFRTLHMIGLAGTATVPLWAQSGICPLTILEWRLEQNGSGTADAPRSFIINLLSDILYLDISPITLSIVTALAALITIVMFVARPPWRFKAK